jgi:peptide/nickel transport system permease protein
MRASTDLDQPWWVRYRHWCYSAVRGDFGTSVAYGVPVRQLLADRLPATLQLNLISTLLAWLTALLLGGLAARHPSSPLDWLVRSSEALLLGLPEILLALVGLWLFGPATLLPYAVLTLGALPVLTAHVRSSVRAALNDPSVPSAAQHGIAGARLWWSYILPLAAAPLLSLAGLSFGGLLSASLLIEATLSVPGLGSLLLDAIHARDTAVVAAVVALSGVTVVVANFAADLARHALDPRLAGGRS